MSNITGLFTASTSAAADVAAAPFTSNEAREPEVQSGLNASPRITMPSRGGRGNGRGRGRGQPATEADANEPPQHRVIYNADLWEKVLDYPPLLDAARQQACAKTTALRAAASRAATGLDLCFRTNKAGAVWLIIGEYSGTPRIRPGVTGGGVPPPQMRMRGGVGVMMTPSVKEEMMAQQFRQGIWLARWPTGSKCTSSHFVLDEDLLFEELDDRDIPTNYLGRVTRQYRALDTLVVELGNFEPRHLVGTAQTLAHKLPRRGWKGPLPIESLPGCARLRSLIISPTTGQPLEEAHQLQTLLLTLFVSCRRLQHLDLTDLGCQAFAANLLDVELPELKLLRVGSSYAGAQALARRTDGFNMPPAVLPKVAAAFPSLQGLDVGLMPMGGNRPGVTTAEVKSLLKICAIQHLDLSMVMHLMDFGPTLQALAAHAPELRSLAVHGLRLPPDDMQALAVGCPHLERLHVVRCREYYGFVEHPEDGGHHDWMTQQIAACPFAKFLKAATNLVEIDVSSDVGRHGELVASLVILKGCVQEWINARLNPDWPEKGLEPVRKVVCAVLGEDDEHGEALLDAMLDRVHYVGDQAGRKQLFVDLVKPGFMAYQEARHQERISFPMPFPINEREGILRENLRRKRDFLREQGGDPY